MLIRLTGLISVIALSAFAAPPWEDPAVNAENRLEARTYLPPADGVRSLAGSWKFWWTGTPENPPEGFERADYDDGAWFAIAVPGCAETQGWGVPHYVNIRYPFAGKPPVVDPCYNPTMYYRTRFAVPGEWSGRRIVLRFEGVSSCGEVWINGRRIGYFEDSRLPSEFDVTSALDLSSPANLLCVKVRKWCDGSFVEDQDMIRYAGIFRDVKIIGEPKDGLRDFRFTTEPDADYRRWRCDLEVFGGVNASASLFDAEGGKVGDFVSDASGRLRLDLPTARLWNDEDPYLYTLVMKSGDDVRRVKVGVRRAEIKRGLFLVNGSPVKLKGVNRHEMNVSTGYTLSYEDMLADVRLMKQNNINCVRTSHYPFDPRWYDLCDEYGIYLCAEANFEAHALGYFEDCIMRRPEWWQTAVERNVRQVLAYRNHPSIVMWSYGNESGWGDGIAKVREAIRKIDPVTPYHGVGWRSTPEESTQPYWVDSDMAGAQYRTIEYCRERIGEDRPFFMMEYACAMGTAMGNFKEYWDVFYESDRLMGGCIWDWIDQAMWIETDRTDANGKRIRYLGYGGDHDEEPNDGPYCANGLVDCFRTPSAKLNEVKHVHQPIVVTAADASDGKAELWNRYEFTAADAAVDGRWELFEDGVRVAEGSLAVPPVAPRAKGVIDLPVGRKPTSGKEGFLRVSFTLKNATKWAGKGHEVAWNQLKFGPAPVLKAAPDVSEGVVKVDESADSVAVACGRTRAVFSRRTGTVSRLEMAGKLVLADVDGIVHGPRLQVIRAWTDSDNWMSRPFTAAGLAHLTHHARPIRIEGNSVTCPVRVTGAKSGGFEFAQTWQFLPDGSIRVKNVAEPFGKIPDLPRIGVFMMLEGGFENMAYYGRGPWENYVDRLTGCDIGLWTTTVSAQARPEGVRPQDCGSHTDVRWTAFTDAADGATVRFSAEGAPFIFSALHFTANDLDQSRHRPGDCYTRSDPRRYAPLVARKETCLSIDCRQTGLGCHNCGPEPRAEYRFPVEKTEWTYVISASVR